MIPLIRQPVGELFESLNDKKNHPAQQASAQAFREEKRSGNINKKQQRIVDILRQSGRDMTAREIHVIMQVDDKLLQANQVGARMTELKGKGIIYLFDKRNCSITTKSVTSWKLRE